MAKGEHPIYTGVPDVGSSICADKVQAGMVVRLEDGTRIDVWLAPVISAGHVEFLRSNGRLAFVPSNTKVKVLLLPQQVLVD